MTGHMAFPVSLIAGLLWVAAFFGLLMKWLGIPRPHQFREEPTGLLGKLGFTQYACLIGALSWGIAMFIASFLNHYLEGKMIGKPVADTSGLWIVSELMLWLVGGCFFGWVMWGRG
jgi:hypothetical protein